MGSHRTKICPGCGRECSAREFRIYSQYVLRCRLCRKRKAAREYARNKAAEKAANERLQQQMRRARRDEELAGLHGRERWFKTVFLKETAVTRRRIRDMEQRENPSKRTARALAQRREILARYEAAYQTQLRILRTGETPPALRDMVQTSPSET